MPEGTHDLTPIRRKTTFAMRFAKRKPPSVLAGTLDAAERAEIHQDLLLFLLALGVIRHAPGAAPSPKFRDVAASFDRILALAEARGWKGRADLVSAVTAKQSTPAVGAAMRKACAMLSIGEIAAELEEATQVLRASGLSLGGRHP